MRHLRSDYDQIQDPSGKIGADEPVFLLRAKDVCAPGAVEAWANLAFVAGADDAMVARVFEWVGEMRSWQDENKDRLQVPDVPEGMLR